MTLKNVIVDEISVIQSNSSILTHALRIYIWN